MISDVLVAADIEAHGAGSLARRLLAPIHALRRHMEARRELAAFRALDDRTLADIGVRREDAIAMAANLGLDRD